jgi:hypothetical protein
MSYFFLDWFMRCRYQKKPFIVGDYGTIFLTFHKRNDNSLSSGTVIFGNPCSYQLHFVFRWLFPPSRRFQNIFTYSRRKFHNVFSEAGNQWNRLKPVLASWIGNYFLRIQLFKKFHTRNRSSCLNKQYWLNFKKKSRNDTKKYQF